MIERIIDFSVRNRPLVFVCVALAILGGWWSMNRIPLDVLPNLGDTQVILYSRWDRSPDIVEDQVTFPIVSALLGTPRVKDVRGFSDFGYSYVYVIFEDNTDLYWARSRTLESLQRIEWHIQGRLRTEADLREAIVHGAVRRIRPKFMTVACMFIGLAPILVSTGAGSDVMKRIAAPMVGGIFTSFLLELIVYPPLYEIWLGRRLTTARFDNARDAAPAGHVESLSAVSTAR